MKNGTGKLRRRLWGLVIVLTAGGAGCLACQAAVGACGMTPFGDACGTCCTCFMDRSLGGSGPFDEEGPVVPYTYTVSYRAGSTHRPWASNGQRGSLLAGQRSIRQLHLLPLLYPVVSRR